MKQCEAMAAMQAECTELWSFAGSTTGFQNHFVHVTSTAQFPP